MTYIIKPFYKDPTTYESREDLIDYVNHLKSEMFNLIDNYNELDSRNEDLESQLRLLKIKIKNILED